MRRTATAVRSVPPESVNVTGPFNGIVSSPGRLTWAPVIVPVVFDPTRSVPSGMMIPSSPTPGADCPAMPTWITSRSITLP